MPRDAGCAARRGPERAGDGATLVVLAGTSRHPACAWRPSASSGNNNFDIDLSTTAYWLVMSWLSTVATVSATTCRTDNNNSKIKETDHVTHLRLDARCRFAPVAEGRRRHADAGRGRGPWQRRVDDQRHHLA